MSGQRDSNLADMPQAQTKRSRLSLIWLIPLVAVLIGGYLAWRTLAQRGPLVTLTFPTADGITADQTQVRHKAVTLGTVEGVRLSKDMSHAIISVRMKSEATPFLTDHARFWVVRPRLTPGNISGLETIVSGAYIEMDPGADRGQTAREFAGLDQPPGVRSDEPGQTYTLVANRLGSLSSGSPVFYRDLNVGEVLSYDVGDGSGPVKLQVFVRKPYDHYVQKETHFWNVSGLSLNIGPEGVHVQIASLQAVLSGGVGFDAPEGRNGEAAPASSSFRLYEDYAAAQNAGFKQKLPFETFFTSSARGLAPGSKVEFLGIQVGTVSSVDLDLDEPGGTAKVRVRFDVQPERIGKKVQSGANSPEEVTRRLVAHGLRAQLSSASLITGQLLVALDFAPNGGSNKLSRDGDVIVLPSTGGGIDSILSSFSDIAQKLDRMNLDELSANLNTALRSATGALSGVEQLARTANQGIGPTMRRLPELTTELQGTLSGANRFLAGADRSYGGDSHFARELDRAMTELGDTSRSIRQLTDFLDRHPEALIRGRTEYGASR